jgi:hypothetical protein
MDIRNKRHAGQITDFSGIRFGRIRPTDIDAFLDFGGKLFVFIETKYKQTPLPLGQRIAYENLANVCNKAGCVAYVLVASHEAEGDIPLATLPVTEIFHNGEWFVPPENDGPLSVLDAVTLAHDGLLSFDVEDNA